MDHPRVCGEQGGVLPAGNSLIGSPPRVRGTGIGRRIALSTRGITPACAGNSTWALAAASVVKDHPRVCGEQMLTISASVVAKGSPPRVRGTVLLVISGQAYNRITPACAGNSPGHLYRLGQWQDHPRVCGEQPRSLSDEAYERGSPPRVRGTAHVSTSPFPPSRITPACAGNSRQQKPGGRCQQDHPRVCGEQPDPLLPAGAGGGSPPRVRGTER